MNLMCSTIIFRESKDFDIFKEKPSNEILHLGKRKSKTSKFDPHTIAALMLINKFCKDLNYDL